MSSARSPAVPAGTALFAAGLVLALAVKTVLAGRWGLIADEAYYWTWSDRPGWGYYDQPPLVAWSLAAARAVGGDHALTLRAGSLLAGLAGPLCLAPFARDRALLAAWWAGVPALAWLTLFATPDALLLGLWAGTLGAALAGGRGWLLAGALGGLAILAKYTAVLLLPALILAADVDERRSRWPWLGLALTALVVLPHAVWLAGHGAVSLVFQLHEGLLHPRPPGPVGLARHLGEQLLVVSPLVWLVGLGWLVRRPPDRGARLCWASAAPVLAGFAVASAFAPGDAHWPAPAWVGIGLGLARAQEPLRRAAWAALALGLASSALLVAQAEGPVVRWGGDPATRLTEGEGLGREVSRVVAEVGLPVRTERYQEAALVAWNAGLPTATAPGCGRDDQYELGGLPPLPHRFLLLRPARSGPATCVDASHPFRERAWRLAPRDARGRPLGPWDLIEVHR